MARCSPLIISILWAIYNMIPPLLVVWYGWVSTGTSLQWLCRCAWPPFPPHSLRRVNLHRTQVSS